MRSEEKAVSSNTLCHVAGNKEPSCPTDDLQGKEALSCNDLLLEDSRQPAKENHRKSLNNPLPVDHGWAWVVMVASFFNIFIAMAMMRGSTLLYIAFLDKYKSSATLTTLPFGMCSVFCALSNLISPTLILPRFQVRSIVMIGCIVSIVCILAIALAPNIVIVIVAYAVIGFALGLIIVPHTTLLCLYFKKRLSFATAFSQLGFAVSTIIGPPFLQLLLESYGLRWALLIVAALTMNSIAATMVLRPTSQYDQPDESKDSAEEAVEAEANTLEREDYSETGFNALMEKHIIVNDSLVVQDQSHRLRSSSLNERPVTKSVSTSDIAHSAYSNHDLRLKVPQTPDKTNKKIGSEISWSSSIKYLNDPSSFVASTISLNRKSNGKSGSFKNIHVITKTSSEGLNKTESRSLLTPNTSRKGPTGLNNKLSDNYSLIPDKDHYISRSDDESRKKIGILQRLKRFSQSSNASMYTHPIAILLIVSSGIGIHTQTIIVFMPAMGLENGLTEQQIPLLVTVIGACDIAMKVFIGMFADLGFVRPIHIGIYAQFIIGTVVQFSRFFQGFGLMIVQQVIIGLTISTLQSLLPVITVEALGVGHVGHVMSGYFLLYGVMGALDNLFVGLIKDATDSYYSSYHLIGALSIIGGVMLLCEPLVQKFSRSRKF